MRLAIYGGTFDPVHNAHLAVAGAALHAYNLDSVLFVPAARPPHKLGEEQESYEHRFRMVQLACSGVPGLEASRLEEHAGTSYSIDTIQQVRSALLPSDSLFFVIGADAFAEFASWHRWKEVRMLVEFLVVSRPGHSYSVPDGTTVHALHSVDMPVSSSEIRRKLRTGDPVPELPNSVCTYIREHGLYR